MQTLPLQRSNGIPIAMSYTLQYYHTIVINIISNTKESQIFGEIPIFGGGMYEMKLETFHYTRELVGKQRLMKLCQKDYRRWPEKNTTGEKGTI